MKKLTVELDVKIRKNQQLIENTARALIYLRTNKRSDML